MPSPTKRALATLLSLLCSLLCFAGPGLGQQHTTPSLKPLLQKFQHGNKAQKRKAAYALMHLGQAAAKGLPTLQKCLSSKDPQSIDWTLAIIASIGPKASPLLSTLLQLWPHAPLHRKRYLLGVIASIGPKAKRAIPLIIKASQASDSMLQMNAAMALGSLHSAPQRSIPALIALLNNPNGYTRQNAIQAIGQFGTQAAPAIPALIKRLKDPRSFGRSFAAETLAKIGQPALIPLLKTLSAPNPKSREYAMLSLQKIGPIAKIAVPILIRQFSKDPNPSVKLRIIDTIGMIGRYTPKNTTHFLWTLIQRPHKRHQLQALYALGFVGKKHPQVIEKLRKMLYDHSLRIPRHSLYPLIALGIKLNLDQIYPTSRPVTPLTSRPTSHPTSLPTSYPTAR